MKVSDGLEQRQHERQNDGDGSDCSQHYPQSQQYAAIVSRVVNASHVGPRGMHPDGAGIPHRWRTFVERNDRFVHVATITEPSNGRIATLQVGDHTFRRSIAPRP